MKIVAICGCGMGSSVILKMNAQKALKDLGIEATVENGAIVLKPARSAKRAIRVANLASVFKDRKEPYQACEDDFGAPVGNEGL